MPKNRAVRELREGCADHAGDGVAVCGGRLDVRDCNWTKGAR